MNVAIAGNRNREIISTSESLAGIVYGFCNQKKLVFIASACLAGKVDVCLDMNVGINHAICQ